MSEPTGSNGVVSGLWVTTLVVSLCLVFCAKSVESEDSYTSFIDFFFFLRENFIDLSTTCFIRQKNKKYHVFLYQKLVEKETNKGNDHH